jgi:hypothetical protein
MPVVGPGALFTGTTMNIIICVFRRNRPRVPGKSSTSWSEATLARTLYSQVVGMGKGELILRRDSPLRQSR